MGALLVRGLVIGLLAGVLAGGFGSAVGEPRIQRAIDLEHARALARGEPPARGPVSRSGQRAGLLLATALYGAAVGGLFALAYAVARGRVGPRTEPALALALAGALFAAVVLVPFAKYPANPPAVGNPATITTRTDLYLVMVAIGLLALVAGVRAAGSLRRAHSARARAAVGVVVFALTAGIAWAVLPGVHEVPPGFPSDLLWQFRLASLGTQAVLWGSLGALFGLATRRALTRGSAA